MANFTFDELNKEMNKISTLGSTMNESAFSEVTDYINSLIDPDLLLILYSNWKLSLKCMYDGLYI